MNLQELIDQVQDNDPELAKKLRSLTPPGQNDLTKLNVNIKFRLEKFDGDYLSESQPVEIIEGDENGPSVTIKNDSKE